MRLRSERPETGYVELLADLQDMAGVGMDFMERFLEHVPHWHKDSRVTTRTNPTVPNLTCSMHRSNFLNPWRGHLVGFHVSVCMSLLPMQGYPRGPAENWGLATRKTGVWPPGYTSIQLNKDFHTLSLPSHMRNTQKSMA